MNLLDVIQCDNSSAVYLSSTEDEESLTASSSSVEDTTRRKKKRKRDVNETESSDCGLFFVMETCAALAVDQAKRRRRTSAYGSVLFRNPVSFKMISDFYGPVMFRRTFCMSIPVFYLLLSNVHDILERKFVSGSGYRRETVPPEVRLAITLRVLAGGSYCDICLAYQVKQSTLYEIVTSTCDALNERLRLEGFPSTEPALHSIARQFQTSRPETSPLYGCVGALDGICVKIKKPAGDENPAALYTRKGFYALPVQALCDSNYIFRYFSSKCTGATHDALAYAVSGLKEDIERGILVIIFFIVGDEAYTCTEELLTPYLGENADFDENNFNYFLSSLRVHIEQAFGMLVARWRILRGGLEYSVSRSNDIVCLLMKLHNFCITHDGVDAMTVGMTEEEKEKLDTDVREWQRQTHDIADEFRARVQSTSARMPVTSKSRKREALVSIVKQKQMRRPNPAPLTVTAQR